MSLLRRSLRLLPKLHKHATSQQTFTNRGIQARTMAVDWSLSNEQLAKDMIIRTAKKQDVDTLTSIWKTEGVRACYEHMHAINQHLSSEGFFVAELHGEIISGIINVPLNDEWAAQGGFITVPEARGRRLGGIVLRTGLQFLSGMNVVADSVPELVNVYKGYGYIHDYDHDIGYAGDLNKGDYLNTTQSTELAADEHFVDLRDIDFMKIMACDRKHHPDSIPRTNYLKWHVIDNEKSEGYAVVKGGEVVAFGTRNGYLEGAYLGPIYSLEPKHGVALLQKLFSEIPEGTNCRIMVPKDNLAANELIKGVGLEQELYAVRIATKYPQKMKLDSYFGYTVAAYVGCSLC